MTVQNYNKKHIPPKDNPLIPFLEYKRHCFHEKYIRTRIIHFFDYGIFWFISQIRNQYKLQAVAEVFAELLCEFFLPIAYLLQATEEEAEDRRLRRRGGIRDHRQAELRALRSR